jgi:hypothetical protein
MKKMRTWFAADKTGFHMPHTLFQTSLKHAGVFRYDEWFVTKLLVHEGVVQGVIALELATGRIEAITARAVILCTGGCGKVFPFTTNAAIKTGDGMALDRLSQAFMQELAKGRTIPSPYGPVVQLDLRHLGAQVINARLPFVRELCLKYQNIDPVTELIPVRPVVRYMMGGVSTDIEGATPLPGLYAAGEIACVSINGANRLGSNSLPELLVFGARAGLAAVEYATRAHDYGGARRAASAQRDERRNGADEAVAQRGVWRAAGKRTRLHRVLVREHRDGDLDIIALGQIRRQRGEIGGRELPRELADGGRVQPPHGALAHVRVDLEIAAVRAHDSRPRIGRPCAANAHPHRHAQRLDRHRAVRNRGEGGGERFRGRCAGRRRVGHRQDAVCEPFQGRRLTPAIQLDDVLGGSAVPEPHVTGHLHRAAIRVGGVVLLLAERWRHARESLSHQRSE